MKVGDRPAIWILSVVVAILLFVILALPGIIRSVAVEKIESATGRKASISRITLNPFTLTAGVSGFHLAERSGGKEFVNFSSVSLRVSPASLTRRALIVSNVSVTRPYVHLVRTAPNTYNFSDLIKPKDPKSKPIQFSINNIEIKNGSVDFLDQAANRPTDHTVRRLDLSIPFFSNIEYLADIYVAPRIKAVINGASFSADGRLKPLAQSREVSIILNIRDADIPYYMAYLPVKSPLVVKSGNLASALELGYRVSANKKPDITLSGALGVRDLGVWDRGGAELLAMRSGLLRVKHAEIVGRVFQIDSLETAGIELFPDRDAQGRWTWQKLAGGPAAEAGKPAEGEPAKLQLNAALIKSMGGKVHFRDRVPRRGFQADLDRIDLTVKNFSTEKDRKSLLDLFIHSARDESVTLKGDLAVNPPAAALQLDVKSIDLASYYPYLADSLSSPVTGKLDAMSKIGYSGESGFALSEGTLTGRNFGAKFTGKDGVRLTEVAVKGIGYSVKQQQARVESVLFKSGDIRLSLDEKGRLTPQAFLRVRLEEKKKKTRAPQKGKAFSYQVKRVEGSGLNVAFTDRTREGDPSFALRQVRFSMENLSEKLATPVPFALSASYGRKGGIAAKGRFSPSPLRLKSAVSLNRIPLNDFDAYLPDNLAVSIVRGALDTRMNIELARTGKKMTGTFAGSLGIRSFYCLDTREDEDLLKWERLQVESVRGAIDPFRLNVGNVSLTNFYSRVVVTKNGTLNLQNLMEREEAPPPGKAPAAAQAPAKVAAAPAAKQATAAGKGAISIGTITLQGGTMVFSDEHLKTPFTTTFYNLGGRVGGLTSLEDRPASVDLRGNLENHSPLVITGSINPLRDNLFLDVTIDFKDIDLAAATPYSGTYLGYVIEKGKLFLGLKYHIENKNLTSENKIFLDQFTFGKQVESDKATKLPVRLAVALLKDSKGEIHLDLPVTGRTDDPQFSVWRLVFQVLRNLLVKAATSPFRLLQAAFGGKGDFSSVAFSPGSTVLSAAEQEKLGRLSQAVKDRPALQVEVTGYVDKDKDPEGYRGELLASKMRTEKFLKLLKEKKIRSTDSPDTVKILPEEYSTYLKAVYRKEKFSKPRNLIGLVKDLPDSEMKKLIFTHTVVGENELRSLAEARAAVVRAYLVDKGKVEQERVFLKRGDIFKAPSESNEVASRVEFGASVK
ncbi:MAG: DUF748 domain-containing protein [Geobacteraceae bacterium]|nr:DUF748 domain-containing protein [Geobacteraceae bacterium]